MKGKVVFEKDALQENLRLKGRWGKFLTNVLFHVLELGSINSKCAGVMDLEGPEFSAGVLRAMGISYNIPESQLDYIPAEGGFITISNHHYGGADGLILNTVVGSRRRDFKIITTFILGQIENLKRNFIPVDNFSTVGSRSISGMRAALGHIASGSPLGLFPAGEVATWQKKGSRTAVTGRRVVEDKPWPDNIIRLIKNSKLPVVPIYFDGENSAPFHILGRIHPRFRTARLAREIINKNGKTIEVRIGKPIAADDIAKMELSDLGPYLRSRCYALEAQCAEPVKDIAATAMSPIAEPVDPSTVRAQMDAVKGKMMFETGGYQVYLLEESDAPEAMRELYRLREETFRGVGEGTGKPLDTDEYDKYYKHLVIWNPADGDIVGSYRIGYGSEIYASKGIGGFYTSTLIHYGPEAKDYLPHCLELGRSFITAKYQREVLPLKLLFTGLMVAVAKDPQARYLMGTVSISNSMPDFYKSLAVRFIEKNYKMADADSCATPTHPFKPNYLRVNPDDMIRVLGGDIDLFDRMLVTISDGGSRLPVLLRKYFSCGARLACFNVDPLFCNSLDGMIALNVSDFPANTMRSFVRPLPEDMQKAIFKHCLGTETPE
ncbi:MAG: lysophospholipid acyltransferase family protein [Bacteroidales bacterium]|nr:lysophospholipid acyltransferase family protein [Bacteroidales bacterium]